MLKPFFALGTLAFSFANSALSDDGRLLDAFLYTTDSNCTVVVDPSNTYHQMYVDGEFKGNYAIGRQDAQLENMLYRYVTGRACSMPRTGPGHPPSDSYGLIERFRSGDALNCSVVYDATYTYNQVYVNGTFRGNYTAGHMDRQLEHVLYRYVTGGVCHLRYSAEAHD